eukprot:g49867.t1
MLAEVYEIRGAGAFSDSTTFAGMGEEECPRLIKRLREMWTGGDDYKAAQTLHQHYQRWQVEQGFPWREPPEARNDGSRYFVLRRGGAH